MRVIKGYAASAHHILAAKLEQMCCLWDPTEMIKDHQWQVMSERLFSFLLFIHHFVNPIQIETICLSRECKMKAKLRGMTPKINSITPKHYIKVIKCYGGVFQVLATQM